MSYGEDRGNKKRKRRLLHNEDGDFKFFTFIFLVVIIAIPTLIIITGSTVVVPAGYRGILLTYGQVTGVLGEGLHFKTPIAQEVQLMSIQVLRADRNKESAATKDLQEVTADVTINYQIDPNVIDTIYKNIGKGYQVAVIEPNIDESLKATTAKFNAEDLIINRDVVKSQLKVELQSRLTQYGITVLSVSFTDFQFSAQFTKSIEDKVTAQQNALKAQNDLARIQFEQQQKIITAMAEANATITNANANAQSILINAEAQAQAILLLQDQLKNNPEYLHYLQILQWDGKLPYYNGGGVIPFLDITTNSTAK